MKKELKQTKRRIRKGDKVIAISGNSRGQSGIVLSARGEKVVVQGLNMCKKHVKRTELNPNGGVMTFEKGIHISNLALYIEGDKPAKVKVRHSTEGERELYYKQGDENIVYRKIKTKT